MKAFEAHEAWVDAHPVKQNGELRRWDEVNDFTHPEDKVARAKKIAHDIFKMTQKTAAETAADARFRVNLRRINRHFARSQKFMQRIVKKAKAEGLADRKENRRFDRRMRRAARNPKAAARAHM